MTISTYLLSSRNVGLIVGKLGCYWMGVSLLTFIFLLIVRLLNKAISVIGFTSISNSYEFIIALIIVVTIFTTGVYNSIKIKVKDYNIGINKNCDLDRLKIVAISDLHLRYINVNKKLKKSVEMINKENADLVVILGDIFDGNFKAIQSERETKEILNKIESKYGTYLCWGNHDAGETFPLMRKFISETNVKLLEDEFINVDDKFIILGRKDSLPIGNQGSVRQDISEISKNIDNKLPLIVLDHQPSNINEYMNIGDLVLSGHTHGGQVYPLNFITSNIFETDYGHKAYENGTQIIVTSGLFTWGPPMRIGTNNEIICVNVLFK